MHATRRNIFVLVAVIAASGVAHAGDRKDLAEKVEDLQSKLEKAQQQIASQAERIEKQGQEIRELRAASEKSWLNERRAEQVRTLVRDVLKDAETRASLAGKGVTAGWDDGFYLADRAGNFLLNIGALSQTRYIYNHADRTAGNDEDQNGFQQRRTRLIFSGHLFDPKFTYRVMTDATPQGGNTNLLEAWFGYAFADGWQVKVGQFFVPFLREEVIGAGTQLTVDRSFVNGLFTASRSQQASLSYSADRWRIRGAVHDGSRQLNTNFNSDTTDAAVAARSELLVAGEWSQFKDFVGWPDDSLGLMLGAGVDYESGESGSGTARPDVFKYTADASLEGRGWNAFAAFTGQHFDDNTSGGPTSADQFGVVAQGGFFVVPGKLDVFGRYEYLVLDRGVLNSGAGRITAVTGDDEISLLTVGANWYFRRHNAKATVDTVWALDPLPVGRMGPLPAQTGSALVGSTDDPQVAVRAQFQLSF